METTDYVSYDLALALKKCGFDEPCYSKWAVEPDGKPFLMGSCLAEFVSSECKGRDVLAGIDYKDGAIHIMATALTPNEHTL